MSVVVIKCFLDGEKIACVNQRLFDDSLAHECVKCAFNLSQKCSVNGHYAGLKGICPAHKKKVKP